jgi:mono/diheme cytochrome c family protein
MRQRCLVVVIGLCLTPFAVSAEKSPAERGQEVMFHRSLNPGVWSLGAYDNLWRQWALTAKPANYEEAVRERYGLHKAPFDNGGRPLGLQEAPRFFGKGLVNNCLMCHAATIAGQTVIGLGNASLDLQSLFEDLTAADGLDFKPPFRFSYVRGTIDPIIPTTFLLQMRDSELKLREAGPISVTENICSDPPAWWLLKRKKTRDWTGAVDARSTRVDMVNLLSPLNSPAYIKGQESSFADIAAFINAIEAPRYPFPVDAKLAAQGREVFSATCSRCHGAYGAKRAYPNKIVGLDIVGTDPLLAESQTGPLIAMFNKTWFARELGPDGKPIQLVVHEGYQAPPLDGVWATAPYLHNGSVPTLYHLLNSKSRPKIYTRSYKTGKEEYDEIKLGWKVTVLEQSPSASAGYERRKIYDTTQPGRSNAGHTFGDELSDTERMAVIEYLKTL